MKKMLRALPWLCLILAVVASPMALAADITSPPGTGTDIVSPPGPSDGSVVLPCPLGSKADCQPTAVIGNVINIVLGLVGSLALIMFVYGGLIWITSAGNKERITTGRNTLVWAALGLVVIFSSYTVINFILRVGFNQT
jgi:hypothetical protein